MRNSPWYIVFLIVVISSLTGYVYGTSEVQTVTVTGKHIEEGRGRRGDMKEFFVIETSKGDLQILKFPIIGYSFGVDEVYNRVQPGSRINVRVGAWPPDIISKYAKPHILAIY